MASFRQILSCNEEELLKVFYIYHSRHKEAHGNTNAIAKALKLKSGQLICAIGFNSYIENLTEVLPLIGYDNINDLFKERNEIYISDIYKKLSLDNILTLYGYVKQFPESMETVQDLMEKRLANIEEKIESTVNSTIIDKYKEEMKAIYLDGIANIDFAEKRLNKLDSGFRALINEVVIITETKLIPAGDIFFRNTVLPEEKRKLLSKGLIPDDLIEARIQEEDVSQREKNMLMDYLKITRQKNN